MTPITRVGSLAICLVLSLASTAALSNLVAVVSSKSAITILSKSQTADLFLGRVSRFPNGVQAVPIDQAEGSAAREEFYVLVAGKSAAQMKTYWSKIIFTGRGQPPKEVTSGAEMKQRIAENPRAIGYIDQSLVDDSVRVVLWQPKD
jgi:ABC-type phosphate transport system substrate-binding protein